MPSENLSESFLYGDSQRSYNDSSFYSNSYGTTTGFSSEMTTTGGIMSTDASTTILAPRKSRKRYPVFAAMAVLVLGIIFVAVEVFTKSQLPAREQDGLIEPDEGDTELPKELIFLKKIIIQQVPPSPLKKFHIEELKAISKMKDQQSLFVERPTPVHLLGGHSSSLPEFAQIDRPLLKQNVRGLIVPKRTKKEKEEDKKNKGNCELFLDKGRRRNIQKLAQYALDLHQHIKVSGKILDTEEVAEDFLRKRKQEDDNAWEQRILNQYAIQKMQRGLVLLSDYLHLQTYMWAGDTVTKSHDGYLQLKFTAFQILEWANVEELSTAMNVAEEKKLDAEGNAVANGDPNWVVRLHYLKEAARVKAMTEQQKLLHTRNATLKRLLEKKGGVDGLDARRDPDFDKTWKGYDIKALMAPFDIQNPTTNIERLMILTKHLLTFDQQDPSFFLDCAGKKFFPGNEKKDFAKWQ